MRRKFATLPDVIQWPYFTAEELARLFWTTTGYVQTLASSKKWRKQRQGHLMTYSFEDARKDLEPRLDDRKKVVQAQRRAEWERMLDIEDQWTEG